MSLSALLLANKPTEAVDNDLDDLFKTSAGPSTRPVVINSQAISITEKVKTKDDTAAGKRKKSGSSSLPPKRARIDDSKELRGKGKEKDDTSEEEDDDDDDKRALSDGTDEDGEESDGEIPIHESLKKEKRKKSKAATIKKFNPEDETREQRDARTIFVGNVPVQVVTSKPLQKQLKRHVLSFVPEAKIESIRFRSVPFKNPTTKLEDEDGKSKSQKRPEAESPSAKQTRQAQRAADWRKKSTKDEEEDVQEKTYLTAQQKRKLAYIKGELNDQATVVHSYIVFAHPIPKDLLSAKVPHKDVQDPYDAAKQAAQKCDGSVFLEHTLRVDVVRANSNLKITERLDASSAGSAAQSLSDTKLSIFVGNLDFASKEEDVRVFFETLLREERGPPQEANNSDIGQEKRWVTRVRVVRDKDTQLGKGFAYVQFADRDCVDEILALEETRLKFAKRKLRVQKCKSVPSASHRSSENKSPSKSQSTDKRNRDSRDQKTMVRKPETIEIPKGDSSLGEKLAGLSKDVRKQLKATDADRVARRLAKKKARHALEKAGVSGPSDKKIRQRERKKGTQRTVNTGRKESKGRVRSDKSMAKRNMKKQ